MAKFIQLQNRWVNFDQVMWVDDSGAEYKIYFEKSTVLVVPKAAGGPLADFLNPPLVAKSKPTPKTKV
jgi:hypothetical protein